MSDIEREQELRDYLEHIDEEELAVQHLAKFDPHTLRTIFRAGWDSARDVR